MWSVSHQMYGIALYSIGKTYVLSAFPSDVLKIFKPALFTALSIGVMRHVACTRASSNMQYMPPCLKIQTKPGPADRHIVPLVLVVKMTQDIFNFH